MGNILDAAGHILSLLGMLAATAVILILAYLAARWVGRSGLSGPMGTLGDPGLQLLRRLRVGRNEELVLVRLHERCLLLGVTAGSITLLRELTAEEASAWLSERDKAADGQASFLEALQKSWTRKK